VKGHIEITAGKTRQRRLARVVAALTTWFKDFVMS